MANKKTSTTVDDFIGHPVAKKATRAKIADASKVAKQSDESKEKEIERGKVYP